MHRKKGVSRDLHWISHFFKWVSFEWGKGGRYEKESQFLASSCFDWCLIGCKIITQFGQQKAQALKLHLVFLGAVNNPFLPSMLTSSSSNVVSDPAVLSQKVDHNTFGASEPWSFVDILSICKMLQHSHITIIKIFDDNSMEILQTNIIVLPQCIAIQICKGHSWLHLAVRVVKCNHKFCEYTTKSQLNQPLKKRGARLIYNWKKTHE